MSNSGLNVFSTFDDVIILKNCHRIHKLENAEEKRPLQRTMRADKGFWKWSPGSEIVRGQKKIITG